MRIVFDEIYEKYHQDLYQFIFYMVKDRQITADLVQDVYMKVLQSYDSFKGDSSIKTWLFSIARHITIDYFRSQTRKRKRIKDFFNWTEKGEFIPDKGPLPEEIAVQNEMIQQVYRYLDHCTPDQKSVLILRFIQLFSIQETAEILGFSISKVKTTQHRGLKTLRTYLLQHEQEGGDVV
ncbi:RNA polymerase sigma factor SigX [Oceanobacillus halotolerans]|uniref:RNA polymerase sigma factor SigX n=1 Tax=Oceanobacillus halotolerans TaxID=2663380 RepID=UPI0013DA3182|nr:RNA polymerase sigma factor SigX [Oceanobacillus halotolerans]